MEKKVRIVAKNKATGEITTGEITTGEWKDLSELKDINFFIVFANQTTPEIHHYVETNYQAEIVKNMATNPQLFISDYGIPIHPISIPVNNKTNYLCIKRKMVFEIYFN